MNALVTGSDGFVGRNLCAVLRRRKDVQLVEYDLASAPQALDEGLASADIIYHLAGVNRPQHPSEFQTGNAEFTAKICRRLVALGRAPKIVLTSSTQVEFDNLYGLSKRAAEEALRQYCQEAGAVGVAYRLKNLFGKWCRPNYNAVTATFCHNIARGLPIQISDPASRLDLSYIDDVVAAFVHELDPAAGEPGGFRFAQSLPSFTTTLGELASLIESFRAQRTTLQVPDFSNPFVRALYATYLSYLETGDFAYTLDIKTDQRGSLAEFVKSPPFGQLFVSRTKPGVTRGNHFHHTKTEKFLVVEGEAVIRFRSILGGADIIEYRVSGRDYRVVDIPPGYTHSIENVGVGEVVTLFWASEVFDPQRPDTQALSVLPERHTP
jgi:UDP-2-acetamido-2,6-beta-L-arabino-hexul-4-ose reductase